MMFPAPRRCHIYLAFSLSDRPRLRPSLYTAGSAVALTGAVRVLLLPHAVTAGTSLYICLTGKPDRG